MIASLENINTQLDYNDLYTDYKAEVVALNLMKYYREVDDIFIKRLGNNNRSFHKDVKNVVPHFYELEEKVVFIETYREGIYDYLPEGVFHPPSLGDIRKGIDNIIAQIQKQKKIEHNARKFFQPFELEVYYMELKALLVECDYDITSHSDLLMDTISELWPLLRSLDRDTARIFIYLLPYFHAVRGNKTWFEKCLSAFLQVNITITFTPNQINDIEEVSGSLVLSGMQLGISSILSGPHFDGERNWAISIGPIPYESLNHYMPQAQLRQLLQIIYSYCLPATIKIEEHFITEQKQESFLLNNKNNSRLGYSTFL